MSSASTQFSLPNLHAMCPLEFGKVNPHLSEAGAASRAWVAQYIEVFTDRKRDIFVRGAHELLCSRIYPYAGYEEFRAVCDFMNLLFVVDDLLDDMSGKDARHACDSLHLAMTDPDFEHHSAMVKMTKEVRVRIASFAKPRSLKRFITHWISYLEGITKEAELREQGLVLDVQSYTVLRRINGAMQPCFVFIEFALGFDLPDEVFENPVFDSIYLAGLDITNWSNDIYSYNKEQAGGHRGMNLVTVVMEEKGIGLQAAINHIGIIIGQLIHTWVVERANLPSWGEPTDTQVSRYLLAIGEWFVGNVEWSFESQRYFDTAHEEVLRTLIVTLEPPK